MLRALGLTAALAVLTWGVAPPATAGAEAAASSPPEEAAAASAGAPAEEDAALPSARVEAALGSLFAEADALEAAFAGRAAKPGDEEWVTAKLAHMVEVDQLLRNAFQRPAEEGYSDAERQTFVERVAARVTQVDRRNTEELKALLDRHGWFTVSEWGKQADKDAWLLVQHADHDIEFQRQVLARLEGLAAAGETGRANFAYLYDRVHALGEKTPQRYGTQGRCMDGGGWEPFPLEDADRVDALRAEVGLGPLAEYRERMNSFCR